MAYKLTGLTAEQEKAVMEEAIKIYNSQENKDKRVINQYESTPNYNVLERTFNSQKRDEYKAKQALAPEYTAAKTRQTEKFIADNGITYDMLDTVFGVQGGNPIGMGTSARMKQTTESKNNENYLKSLGADMDYLEKYYKSELNNKALQNVADATKNAPVAMNALSSVGNTLSNASYGLGTGLEWLTGNTTLADDLDFGVQANQAIRQTTKEDVIGEDKKVGNLLYDVGMGAADFGGSLALGGGNPLLARLFQTSSAVGGSAYDAKERGLTDSQAMAEGLLGGAAEYALSKLPFDVLTRTNADDAFLKTILKQGASEALEEGGTSAFNAIADSIIAGENSNFNLKKKEYMASGMSEEEATKQAFFDALKEIGYEGAVGGLSGGVIGGVNTTVQRVGNRSNNSIVNELEPLAESIAEPIAKTTESGNTATLNAQPTNTMANSESALNSQIQNRNNIGKNNIDTLTETAYNYIENSNVGLTTEGNEDYGNESERSRIVLEGMDAGRNKGRYENDTRDAGGRADYGANRRLSKDFYVIKNTERQKLNSEGITDNEFWDSSNNPELFSFALESGKASTPNGVMVDGHAAEELRQSGAKTFLAKNNLAGGAVLPDGNIVAVFKNSKSPSKRAVADIIITALENGGTKLDCYGSNLLKLYARLGFEPVARVKFNPEYAPDGWDFDKFGMPDIYAMIHNGKPVAEVVDDYVNDTARKFAPEEIDNLPYMEYDDAMEYRDSLIPQANVVQVSDLSNTIVPDLANVETVNPYTSTENIQSDNQRVRSYNTTLTEKTDAPQVLKNEFIENPQIYTQLSNKATLDFAMDILNNNDLNTAIVEYRKMLDAKNPTAIPLGYNISKQLVADGRLDESVQIIRDMSKALTESGQFSQAAAITLMNNDPETAKRYLIKEIDNLNKKGTEKFGKKWKNFEISEDELKKFDSIQPGDADAIKQAYQDVYNRLRKEYPSTFKEKLMEYRRVAMLLNVRTNIRNVVSNAMLFPVRWTADRVSALGDGVYSLINPEYQRTQSLNPVRSAKAKKLANEIFEANKDVLLNENKYDDAKDVMRDKQVFKGTKVSKALDTALNGAITKANQAMGKDINPSLMETARNFTYYLLQKGDDVFVKQNFISRLSSYLDAQGITDIADVPPDAITLATQEAMKATFKDDTKLSQTLSNFRKNFGVVGDIIMPFTKTPANLAMRGIDYSPVGVINGIKTLRNATTNEEVAKGITQLGQAVTGTAAIALGYVLAESGIITGALSDDKDEAQFEKQQGKLAYSIKTPLGYVTYDWAQPASIPMILGATIYDSLNEDVSLASGLKKGGLAVADSWLELSPLQNLSDIFGGYGTPAENVLDVLATDFPLSFLPSQLGAIARATDTTQRTTYSNDYFENLKNQAMAKIPGLSQKLPATYDTWGNEVQRYDNVAEGLFANMINPGQFGNESTTPIDNEIIDLYEATGNASVFPKKASWTENNQKLSAEEYSEFQRISGSNSYDMVEALIESSNYQLLDDEQKADIIADIYNFSNALADKEITDYDIETSKTYGKAYSVYEEAGAEGIANYYAIKKLKAGDKQSEIVTAIEQMNLSNNEKGYYLSLFVEPNKETAKLFNSKNWDEFYDYYFEKTAKDRRTSSYNQLDPFFSY